ncbi:peptidoglycan editing factor PgeF [Chelatococcus reniformis]|uniref:Purine nucleoside phosphorylase n=1 Tax=Chelatococcus reniformis TaxID=1494448 RepID=A0A916UN92_9HYPH|nr:peptidoglycan editing factor PgeF [Chelatococcus reniformis]GGC80296.1 laccase domain protein [Chelatococcus reniformis]
MVIEAERLKQLPGVAHAFFTRQGGVSEGIFASLNGGLGSDDEAAAVMENRRRMAARFGLPPERLLGIHQVHSPDVAVAVAPWPERPKVDAVVTRVPDLALGVASADCGPVLFADGGAGVVGAAHAGWRGAFTGVLEATVAAMEGLGARREQIVAVLGPTIGPTAYEVGPEFVARFIEAEPANEAFFAPSARTGHAMFDLPSYIVMRLGRAGIGHAESLGLCTYGDEARFYSYRRTTHRSEPDYGRLISAICIKG